jgi:hypothetical protein
MELTGTITIGNLVVPYVPTFIPPGGSIYIDSDNCVILSYHYTLAEEACPSIFIHVFTQPLRRLLPVVEMINEVLKSRHPEKVVTNAAGNLEVSATLRNWLDEVAPVLATSQQWHLEKLEILDEFDPYDEKHIDFNALSLIALSVDDIGEPQEGKRTVAPGLLAQSAFKHA